MFVFSAPGDSPLPSQRNPHGIGSDIYRDVVKTQTVVNDVHAMLQIQGGADGQHLSTSVTRAQSVTEYTFTVPYTQTGSQPQLSRDPAPYIASSVPGELPLDTTN